MLCKQDDENISSHKYKWSFPTSLSKSQKADTTNNNHSHFHFSITFSSPRIELLNTSKMHQNLSWRTEFVHLDFFGNLGNIGRSKWELSHIRISLRHFLPSSHSSHTSKPFSFSTQHPSLQKHNRISHSGNWSTMFRHSLLRSFSTTKPRALSSTSPLLRTLHHLPNPKPSNHSFKIRRAAFSSTPYRPNELQATIGSVHLQLTIPLPSNSNINTQPQRTAPSTTHTAPRRHRDEEADTTPAMNVLMGLQF